MEVDVVVREIVWLRPVSPSCSPVAASAAFACSMAGMPAYALTDTNLDEWTTGSLDGGYRQSLRRRRTNRPPCKASRPRIEAESMPDNPTKDLPQTVSEAVPDDATVVSEELAVTDAGEVMDLETGDTVTDPQLVGTVDKPADPLAKTDGESFIPVEVAEVKEAMGDAAAEAEPDDAADTEDDGDVAEPQRDVPRTTERRVPWCGPRPCRTTRMAPTGARTMARPRSSSPMARCSRSRPRA